MADQRRGTERPLLRILVIHPMRSEGQLSANSVEKHPFASAENRCRRDVRRPLPSGFSRLLRGGKDLRQLPEVLGGGGEEEFVVCAARAA